MAIAFGLAASIAAPLTASSQDGATVHAKRIYGLTYYPTLAASARVEGKVIVEVTTDSNGRVTSSKVVLGHPLLRHVVEENARLWIFDGATDKSNPLTISYHFRLVGSTDKHPKMTFSYEVPDTVYIESEAPEWQP